MPNQQKLLHKHKMMQISTDELKDKDAVSDSLTIPLWLQEVKI